MTTRKRLVNTHSPVRVVALLLAALGLGGCGFVGGWTDDDVPEGQRCNPFASHNDCASGLVCTTASDPSGTAYAGQSAGPVIPFCPENYCCAVDESGKIKSSDPNCQPGCNGGAASICLATGNAGACALADGGSLKAALALEDAGAD